MPDPIAAPSATLAGQAAAIPAAAVVHSFFGVPYELLAWGLFGGLIAVANSERSLSGWRLFLDTAIKLTIGAGIGGAMAGIGAEVASQFAGGLPYIKFKLPGSEDVRMLRCMAIFLGACTAVIPDAYRILRALMAQKTKGAAA